MSCLALSAVTGNRRGGLDSTHSEHKKGGLNAAFAILLHPVQRDGA
nr:MAG TPA: hypothetical protein [Caudoviricetes sp.]